MNATASLEAPLLLLPHGPEFRFLDRLISLEPGKCGEAQFEVQSDAPYLRGHFPGHPLFPGVLLIEAAAQLAGVVAQSDPLVPPLAGLKLTALRNVKIIGTARPTETIRLAARISGRFGNLVQAEASAHLGLRTIMIAELTLSGDHSKAESSATSR